MNIAEIRMLRWMCVLTRSDVIKNEYMRGNLYVTNIVGKMSENRLRSFGILKEEIVKKVSKIRVKRNREKAKLKNKYMRIMEKV